MDLSALSALDGLLNDLMYTDTMTITGQGDKDNEDGSTDPDVPTIKAENVPCKVSYSTLDVSSLDDERDKTHIVIKILCSTGQPIAKGDTIVAQKRDPATDSILQEHEGQAGLPAFFLVHQEIELLHEG